MRKLFVAVAVVLALSTGVFACPVEVSLVRRETDVPATWPWRDGVDDAVVLNVASRELHLYADGVPVFSCPIAIGHPSSPTPLGWFVVVSKIAWPTWYPTGQLPVPPGPNNPLGRWWLGLDAPGYGLHGTNDPSSIGRAVSKGCVRLHNDHVDRLVELVEIGDEVLIGDEPVEIRLDPAARRWWLAVHHDPYHDPDYPSTIRAALSECVLEAVESELDELLEELEANPPVPGRAAMFEIAFRVRVANELISDAYVGPDGLMAPIRKLAAAVGERVDYVSETKTAVVRAAHFCGPLQAGTMYVPVDEFLAAVGAQGSVLQACAGTCW